MRCLYVILLMFVSGFTYAQGFPATSSYFTNAYAGDFATPELVCSTGNQTFTTASGIPDDQPWGIGVGRCSPTGIGVYKTIGSGCPSNSTASGGNCTCNSGYITNATNNGCIQAAGVSCQVGRKGVTGSFGVGRSPSNAPSPFEICSPNTPGAAVGCKATFRGDFSIGTTPVNGVREFFVSGTYVETGGLCATSTANAAPTPLTGGIPKGTCGAGQVYGQINNVDVCVDSSTGKPTNLNQPPPKTTETTVKTESTTGGGSQTTETTRRPDGAVSVTVTVKDANGEVTGKTTTESNLDPTKAFCEDNPAASICSKSVWSGACTGGFRCDGDAATCAIARAAAQMRCEEEKTSPALTLGQQLLDGQDPASDLPTPGAAREIDVGSIDESGWLGRNCLADEAMPIGFMGVTVTLPWSQLCTAMQAMGAIMVLASLLSAGVIVGFRPS